MSVWSKLGLADKEMLLALQKEITELRAENASLIQKQSDKISQELEENAEISKTNLQVLVDDMRKLSATANVINEKTDGLNAEIEKQLELATRNSEQTASILELIRVISMEQKQHFERVKKFEEIREVLYRISEQLSEYKRLNEANQKEITEMAKEILNIEQSLDILMTKVDEKGGQLKTIEAYLTSLWEAMKLVWINDMMNQYENGE